MPPLTYAKSFREIEIMRECGRRLKAVHSILMPQIEIGMTTLDIEHKATKLLSDYEIQGSFQTVDGYPWNTCIAVNDQAVHTMPSKYIIKPGDVLTVDMGGLWQGYHTDWATTCIVGNVPDSRKERFLKTGTDALHTTLSHMKAGESLDIVAYHMQKCIYGAGYKILKDLTGHGLGRQLHEDPHIPNFIDHKRYPSSTYRMEVGFVAAIEIIYSETSEKIIQRHPDNWSLDTADGSIAACFEHTVLIRENDVEIFT